MKATMTISQAALDELHPFVVAALDRHGYDAVMCALICLVAGFAEEHGDGMRVLSSMAAAVLPDHLADIEVEGHA